MDYSASQNKLFKGKLKLSHLFPLLFQNKLQIDQIFKCKKYKVECIKRKHEEIL